MKCVILILVLSLTLPEAFSVQPHRRSYSESNEKVVFFRYPTFYRQQPRYWFPFWALLPGLLPRPAPAPGPAPTPAPATTPRGDNG
ncbi:hypothetical protein MATL_G00222310 [Megalops atlanticus]|uniref:Uncharacterized protein n=1 Tax=Megalops atlanticus TaxID=7932 RepID=A0A9D3T2N3_MEGAT|nr:hypothetical protein MATL_G00222310 [Megalops atlanticus]